MEQAILYVDNLTLEYRTAKRITIATYRVGFELFKGERLAIVGKSGCGKSTLLNAVGGFATPQYHSTSTKDKSCCMVGPLPGYVPMSIRKAR